MNSSTTHTAALLPPFPSTRPLWTGRGLALTGIVLSAFNMRTAVTSLTPLLQELGDTFGFSTTMAGVFGMLPVACFAVFGASAPRVARLIGLERTALLAMILAATGLFSRAGAGTTGALLFTSIVALAGMGIGNVVLPPLVKRYFADRVSAVSSLYITMLQLGTTLPALVAVPLAVSMGWRVSLGSWGIFAALAALPWIVLLLVERRKESPLAQIHDHAVTATDEAPELAHPAATGKVWRSPVAWGLALVFGMTSLITYSMFTWLPKLLGEAGGSAALGGSMVALFSTLGLISAFTMPMLATRIRNPFWIVLACCCFYVVAFLGLLLAPMRWPLLWVALLGMGPSTFPLALTMINLRTRSPAGSAALSGFMQGVGYTLACTGPFLFGWLHSLTHGWEWPFAFLGLCMLALLLGGYLVGRPRMLEDTW